MAFPGLFFLFLSFQYCWQQTIFNKNFADDGIRTADLLCRNWPLTQLSHNHCPTKTIWVNFFLQYLNSPPNKVKASTYLSAAIS